MILDAHTFKFHSYKMGDKFFIVIKHKMENKRNYQNIVSRTRENISFLIILAQFAGSGRKGSLTCSSK
jgi:hypothetical protein